MFTSQYTQLAYWSWKVTWFIENWNKELAYFHIHDLVQNKIKRSLIFLNLSHILLTPTNIKMVERPLQLHVYLIYITNILFWVLLRIKKEPKIK